MTLAQLQQSVQVYGLDASPCRKAVSISDSPSLHFLHRLSFLPRCTHPIASWTWDFGDFWSSTAHNKNQQLLVPWLGHPVSTFCFQTWILTNKKRRALWMSCLTSSPRNLSITPDASLVIPALHWYPSSQAPKQPSHPRFAVAYHSPTTDFWEFILKKKLSWYLLRIFSIFLGGKLSSPLLFNVRSFNTAWQSLEAPSSRSWDRETRSQLHMHGEQQHPGTGTTSAPQKPADLFSRPTGWQVHACDIKAWCLHLDFTSSFLPWWETSNVEIFGSKLIDVNFAELFYWEFANQKLLVGSHPKKQTESCQAGVCKKHHCLGKNHAQTMPRNH